MCLHLALESTSLVIKCKYVIQKETKLLKCTRNLARPKNNQCKIVWNQKVLRMIKSLNVAKECILKTATRLFLLFLLMTMSINYCNYDDERIVSFCKIFVLIYNLFYVQDCKWIAFLIYCANANIFTCHFKMNHRCNVWFYCTTS